MHSHNSLTNVLWIFPNINSLKDMIVDELLWCKNKAQQAMFSPTSPGQGHGGSISGTLGMHTLFNA